MPFTHVAVIAHRESASSKVLASFIWLQVFSQQTCMSRFYLVLVPWSGMALKQKHQHQNMPYKVYVKTEQVYDNMMM